MYAHDSRVTDMNRLLNRIPVAVVNSTAERQNRRIVNFPFVGPVTRSLPNRLVLRLVLGPVANNCSRTLVVHRILTTILSAAETSDSSRSVRPASLRRARFQTRCNFVWVTTS